MLARGLSDPAIMHSGWAGTLAGATQQAKIEMFFEAIIECDATFGCCFDQMDSATR